MQRAKVMLVIAAAALVALTLSGAQQPVRAIAAAPLAVSCPWNALVTVGFPDSIDPNEYRLVGSGPGLPSAGRFTVSGVAQSLEWILPGPGSWTIRLVGRHGTSDWDFSKYSSALVVTCLAPAPAGGPLYANLLDGRINDNQSRDGAAPVTVYCADDVLDIYTINPATSEGQLVIRHEIVAGAPGSANELIAASDGVSLYRLSSGVYQLNTTYADGKPYIITWEGCGGANLTHLAS